MDRRYWTAEDDRKLRQFRSNGITYDVIADAFGRTERACINRMEKLNRRAAFGEKPKAAPRAFTDAEVAAIVRMRDVERREFKDIDSALRRNPGVCCQKYQQVKGLQAPPRRLDDVRNADVPPACAADRDERLTLSHTTITAAFFGDPLPGRSALDMRSSRLQAAGQRQRADLQPAQVT